MKKSLKILAMFAMITQIILFSTGCSNSSVVGKYYREFGSYTSSTMYIELKSDKTYQTDGLGNSLVSKGTYEVSDSIITFTYIFDVDHIFGGGERTLTGEITEGTITIEDAVYKK